MTGGYSDPVSLWGEAGWCKEPQAAMLGSFVFAIAEALDNPEVKIFV